MTRAHCGMHDRFLGYLNAVTKLETQKLMPVY